MDRLIQTVLKRTILILTSKWFHTHLEPSHLYFFSCSLPLNPDGSVNERLLPSVGNGHIATNVFTDTLFVNGVYTGRLGESHRARIQSLYASEWEVEGCADPQRTYRLDTRQGMTHNLISLQPR